MVPEVLTPKLIPQKHTSGCQNTKATDATLKDVTPKEATPTPEEQDECSVREYRQLVLIVACMSEAHTMQRVPSCTKTRYVELKCLTLQRKESDHPGKVN